MFREARHAATYVHLKTPSLAGLREVCRLLNIRGLSVTTPFKEAVLAAADRIDDSAQAIGAANTLAWTEGEWVASNTDWRWASRIPCRAALEAQRRGRSPGLPRSSPEPAGWAAPPAVALREMGCRVAMTSRGQDRLRRATEALGVERVTAVEAAGRKWDIIVNATPAGSAPAIRTAARSTAAWAAPGAIVVETNYRPLATPLVSRGARSAAST